MLYQIILVDTNGDVRNGGRYRATTASAVDIEADRRAKRFTEACGKEINWAMSLEVAGSPCGPMLAPEVP